jgi:predicted RNA-binding protein associated with RNAse of E/G family
MSAITVYKLNLDGRVTWQYQGVVLRRGENEAVIEAFFDRKDMPFQGITLKQGDRFVESFFNDRWYNIFEIYDRDDGRIKGYYCNIGRPAVLGRDSISYVDLALDLWVTPDGHQTVLDEDEFLSLDLDRSTREQALVALETLKRQFRADVSSI